MNICSSVKHQYESLKTMKQEFVVACEKAGNVDTLTNQQLETLQRRKLALETATTSFKEKIVVSPERAKEIMGVGSYFGPEALAKTFGVDFDKKDISRIPWSTHELKEARDRGEMLILRTDKDKDGKPLTAEAMVEHCTLLLEQTGKGKVLASVDWYKNEPFYTKEKCSSGWALVGKEFLSKTTNQNYLQQTDRIIQEIEIIYAKKKIPCPKHYQDAIDDFVKKRPEIEKCIKNEKWSDASTFLAELDITTMTRQNFVEALSDILTVKVNVPDHSILETTYVWTSSRSSSGDLVSVGDADGSGAGVNGWDAGSQGSSLGVLFVRRGPVVSRPS